MIKIIYKRLGYVQVEEVIPYEKDGIGLFLAIELARTKLYNGAEYAFIVID